MSSHQRQTEWRVSVLVSEVPGEPEPQDRWSHSYLVRNLQPSSVYQVEVRARNRHGWSPVSRLHTFFTQTGGPANGNFMSVLLLFGNIHFLILRHFLQGTTSTEPVKTNYWDTLRPSYLEQVSC